MTLKLSVSGNLSVKKGTKGRAPVLVVFADKDGNILGNLDVTYHKRAQQLVDVANFDGTAGASVCDFALDDSDKAPLAVIGVGTLDKGKFAANLDKIAKTTYKLIKTHSKAVIAWGDTICEQHFGHFVRHLLGAAYRFDAYKSDAPKPDALTSIEFVSNKVDAKLYKETLVFVQAVVLGQELAKDLGNEVPNILNPSYFAKVAKNLGKEYSDVLNVNVLDEKDMQKLGMGCFLSVSKGSQEEGKMVIIEYYGKSGKAKNKPKGKKSTLDNPIALVGKGITFDSGGISLKPGAGMDEMKFDMGGAGAMLGTLKAVCAAKLPIDVVVVLACAENMPSGNASRPGDVVTAMNGTTVEILNTDAEGRLVLCDALCYVQDHYAPKVIIDAATLTGACVVALGSVRSAVYSNDEDTLFALQDASEYTQDLIWQMPLDDAYGEQIKSTIADLQNVGGPKAGSVTAACFLKRFIKEGQAWAHLDIAGTAWLSGENKGATGRPVPMLTQYLKDAAKS